jgi:NAD(P)-dependent dehydrogenase (short-subunit alcohol dehydrogenase family)
MSESSVRVIILGATSAIAEAAARQWAERNASIVLAGRNLKRLEAISADLGVRGAKTEIYAVDLAKADAEITLKEIAARLGGVDIIFLAYGILGSQRAAESTPSQARDILETNFLSAAEWCLAAAHMLENQGHGTLVVIGSVAGDRGRQSNYVYGAAKGGLGILVEGIAHRLASKGARAVLIKPGFVDTPMTADIPKKGPLWATPEAIARTIVSESAPQHRGSPVIYAPSFWRWIMLAIKSTPAFIFHRTTL